MTVYLRKEVELNSSTQILRIFEPSNSYFRKLLKQLIRLQNHEIECEIKQNTYLFPDSILRAYVVSKP